MSFCMFSSTLIGRHRHVIGLWVDVRNVTPVLKILWTWFHLPKGPVGPQIQTMDIFSDTECRIGLNIFGHWKISTLLLYGGKLGQEKPLELPLISKIVKQKVIIFLGIFFYGFFTSQTLGRKRVKAEISRPLEAQS